MRKHMIHPSLYAYEFMELTPYKTYVYALQRDDKVYIIDTFWCHIYGNHKGRLPEKEFCCDQHPLSF